MTLVTIRPNGNPQQASWTLTGAASVATALSDNSDASYVTTPAGAWNGTNFVVDFGTFALPSLAQVRSVTPRLRVTAPSSGLYPYVTTGGWLDVVALANGGPTNYTLAARTTKTDGTAWTQADIDAIQMSIAAGGAPQWFELYIDVVYNEAPAVTVTGPTGTVTTTTAPTVTWTYTDPDGDTQERCRVKIFSAAQYGAGGFDPETSTPTYDSGEVFTSALSLTVGALADTTTYRAYVKIADAGSSGRYSAWAFSGFSIALAQGGPATPVLLASADNANARVQLVVQGRDNLLTTNQASLETDTTGWAAGALTTIARTTSQFLVGAASMSLTAQAGANPASAQTPTGASGFAVQASKQYTAMASFRTAVTARTCTIQINWYKSNGSASSVRASDLSQGVTDSTSGWVQAVLVAIAPSDAAFAAITTSINGALATSEVHYVDAIGVAPSGGNLLSPNQASLEFGQTGWAAAVNCSIGQSATYALDGSFSLAMAASGGGDMSAQTPTGTGGVAVFPSTQYTALASFRTLVARSVQVLINWYTAAGAAASTPTSTGASVVDGSAGFTQAFVTATSPADAAYASVVLKVLSAGGSEVHYADCISLAGGSSTTWQAPSAWARGGVPAAPSTTLVEYSDNGGVTWATLRGAAAAAFDSVPDQLCTVYDYESPPNTARLYRAKVQANVGGALTSSPSATVSATVVPGSWWLKDPITPSRNLQIYPDMPIKMTKDEAQAVLRPLGRTREVVVADTVVGEHLALVLQFTSAAQRVAFDLLRNSQRVLLLQSPGTEQWYGRIIARRSLELQQTPDMSWRKATVEFGETDAI